MDGAAVLPALREPKGPEVVKTPGLLGKKWGKCWGRANTTAPPRPPHPVHEQLDWISFHFSSPEINRPPLIPSRSLLSNTRHAQSHCAEYSGRVRGKGFPEAPRDPHATSK